MLSVMCGFTYKKKDFYKMSPTYGCWSNFSKVMDVLQFSTSTKFNTPIH
jgi:hypothetical protein